MLYDLFLAGNSLTKLFNVFGSLKVCYDKRFSRKLNCQNLNFVGSFI